MILDSLDHAGLYEALGENFRIAFEWLRRNGAGASGAPVKVHGDRVVARPGAYETHERAPGKFECHRKFADIQFVAEGEEIVEVAPARALCEVSPYDEGRDIAWFSSAAGTREIRLAAGSFVVLFPHEAHQPGVSPAAGPCRVRKVVMKVEVAG